jgi:folate-binding protein YgfZ
VTASGLADTVAAEYAAARKAAGLVDLTDRAVLEATGPQRQKFLQGMLSNDVLGLSPGGGCLAALMTAKGHVQVLLRALVEKDAVVLEMPADRLELVERTLNHYRVAAPVRFKARATVVLGLLGPQVPDVVHRAGVDVPDLGPGAHAQVTVAGRPAILAYAPDLPGGGRVAHVSPEDAPAVREALRAAGARPIGRETVDILRVEALRPWYGPDVTEDNLLHETGLLGEYALSTKGCYIGQEVVARLDARGGHVNKELRGLTLSAPVAAGTKLLAGDKEVGRITTPAVSPRLGPIALGYVHRSHFAAGTVLRAGEASATVVTSFRGQ